MKNVAPTIEDLTISFDWDQYGISFDGVTVSGRLTDPGSNDRHTLSVAFSGYAYGNPTTFTVMGQQFAFHMSVPGNTDLYRFYPVRVAINDDDLGTDSESIDHSCTDATNAIGLSSVEYVAGRGTFVHDTQPGATNTYLAPTATAGGGSKIGSEIVLSWGADKRAFEKKGQCMIGFVQIVNTVVDYEGIYGNSIVEPTLNRGWHVDHSVPYPHSAIVGYPTSDNPFSRGLLSLQDTPGIESSVGGSSLVSGEQRFETCVVALPTGTEFNHTIEVSSGTAISRLNAMAIYGCVSWGHQVRRNADGSYTVWRSLELSTTNDNGQSLEYTGIGRAPSQRFIELIEQHYFSTSGTHP